MKSMCESVPLLGTLLDSFHKPIRDGPDHAKPCVFKHPVGTLAESFLAVTSWPPELFDAKFQVFPCSWLCKRLYEASRIQSVYGK